MLELVYYSNNNYSIHADLEGMCELIRRGYTFYGRGRPGHIGYEHGPKRSIADLRAMYAQIQSLQSFEERNIVFDAPYLHLGDEIIGTLIVPFYTISKTSVYRFFNIGLTWKDAEKPLPAGALRLIDEIRGLL